MKKKTLIKNLLSLGETKKEKEKNKNPIIKEFSATLKLVGALRAPLITWIIKNHSVTNHKHNPSYNF